MIHRILPILGCGLALLMARQALAQEEAELVSPDTLRVCADPSDLPFSNDKGEGFENRIAQMIGADLHRPVRYTFYPDSQGFIRATLMKDRCDVVMGTAVGNSDVTTTAPYYFTGYVIVTRDADHITATRVNDPALAGRRFGLIGETPPTNLLVQYDLMDQTKIYPLIIDTRVQAPSHDMLKDLMNHQIDAALLWGPFAGYFIRKENLPLHVAFLDGSAGPVRLSYHIAMGVRGADTDFRRLLNGEIEKRQADITKVLRDYGIPLLAESGQALP